MKKLVAATMIGLGLLVGGCGNSVQQPTATQQTQQVQQNEGISLSKAIDLAKKGEFKPQKVKYEGDVIDKVFGDEPEIIVHHMYNLNGETKMVNIHVKDPVTIKAVAETQEKRKKTFVSGYSTTFINEIEFTEYSIEVK